MRISLRKIHNFFVNSSLTKFLSQKSNLLKLRAFSFALFIFFFDQIYCTTYCHFLQRLKVTLSIQAFHSPDAILGVDVPQDDSNLLASAGCDQVIRIWDVRSDQCVQTFRGHTGNHYLPLLVFSIASISFFDWDLKKKVFLHNFQTTWTTSAGRQLETRSLPLQTIRRSACSIFAQMPSSAATKENLLCLAVIL